MTRLLLQTSIPFRPNDPNLSAELESLVQFHRVLTLLAAILVPAFGLLYTAYNPLAVDPVWARLGLSGLFLSLFTASYWSDRIKRAYVSWLHGLLYVLVGWTVLLAAVNHFTADYVAGLLTVYAAVIAIVGIGARTLAPVVWFSGAGLFATAVTATTTVAPYTSPLVLLACMTTVAVVEGIAIRGYQSTRDQLNEREERLRGLANSVPGVVFQFVAHDDGSYGSTFVSDRATAVLGLSSNTTNFYERFLECVPARRRKKLVDSIDRAVENESPWRFEMPFVRPDGKRLWLLGTSTPERRGDDLVFNGVVLDITERKRAEDAVQDRENKIQALYTATERLLTAASNEDVATRLENIIRGTFDYAFNGVDLVRDGSLRRRAHSTERPVQRPTLPSSDDHASLAKRAYQTGETQVVEHLANQPVRGDSKALTSGVCVPIGSYGVLTMASTEEDEIDAFDVRLAEILSAHAVAVFDRIDREERLVAAKEDAEKASQLKSAILANMSHEFRTPLTAVMGFSEILANAFEGEAADFGERIHRSSRRLLSTLDAVLKLSRLKTTTQNLELDCVNLNRVVEKTIDLRVSEARERDVELHLDLPSSPLWGQWSEGALNRIAEILIDNALKFTPEGGAVYVRTGGTGGRAVLEVEDTGVGISDDAVSNIFDAFEQESDGFDRDFEGAGLGLAIAKALAQEMGGDIEVESEKHDGSTFSVFLPLPRTPAPAVS